jgi:hypothetical protein
MECRISQKNLTIEQMYENFTAEYEECDAGNFREVWKVKDKKLYTCIDL